MGEGLPLSPQCLAKAAGPTPWPGPTAWAYRIGRAQTSDRAGTYAPGRHPRLCAAAQRTISPRADSRAPPRSSRPAALCPSPMQGESIASCREFLPTQAASVTTEERAGREAVIGPYPDVLVPGGPPTGRLLQGDALPRRCQLFRPTLPSVQGRRPSPAWPNNSS
jgi:hypothetical protein